jgi:starch synthase
VPIVRGVGGLVNTVFDRDYDEKQLPEKRNGYVFYETDYLALESAMDRALDLWYNNPSEFRQLQRQGMNYDYSWNYPGKDYLEIYERIRHK